MSEKIEQYFYIFLITAIVVLGWGLVEFNKAGFYKPALPAKAAPNSFDFSRKEKVYPLERYQVLLSGDLFFGKPEPTPAPVVPVKPKIPFVSHLIVLGITKGTNASDGYAVVGTKATGGQQTWIAKVGMTIEGEKIVQIKDGYIMVSNKTGTGKVLIQK